MTDTGTGKGKKTGGLSSAGRGSCRTLWCRSLGCPKNRVDTEKFVGALGSDFTLVDNPRRADVIFVNTCGFIEPAVRESLRTVMDLADECGGGRKKPLLVVAGCMVGRYGSGDLAAGMPEVDLWLEPAERDTWPAQVRARLDAGEGCALPGSRLVSTPPSYAYLKVSEGCRHRCAFCTIPSIRGPLKSSPRDALVDEARFLVEGGAKELVLIAQDLTDYGHDFGSDGDGSAFVDLLHALADVDGLAWMRMLYLYPKGVTPKLLAAVRDLRPLLPYFDIPLQHSHPDVLRSMGRPFAVEAERVLDTIREALPEAALRTTFIVGYPGETEEHFEHLCSFVERMRFTQLGVFTYWPEEGTRAAELPDQVDPEVKEERRDRLMELQRDISAEILENEVGSAQDVLVDSVNPEWPGLHNGRVWFQAPDVDGMTYVSGPGVAPGAMVRCDIVESGPYDLTALAAAEEEKP